MARNSVRRALAPPCAPTALLVDMHWVDVRPELIGEVFDDAGDVYNHRLVAASAWLIRRHLPLLRNVPVALAPTGAAARVVLLERARTLLGRGLVAARVYGDPWLRRAVAEAGLVVLEQPGWRLGLRSVGGGLRLPRSSGVTGSAR